MPSFCRHCSDCAIADLPLDPDGRGMHSTRLDSMPSLPSSYGARRSHGMHGFRRHSQSMPDALALLPYCQGQGQGPRTRQRVARSLRARDVAVCLNRAQLAPARSQSALSLSSCSGLRAPGATPLRSAWTKERQRWLAKRMRARLPTLKDTQLHFVGADRIQYLPPPRESQ